MQVHSDEHEFQCELCDRSYKWSGSLASHMRSAHARPGATAPFTCAVCGKTFNDKSNLNTHMQSHETVKRHRCTNCDRSFIRKDQLVSHQTKCLPPPSQTISQQQLTQ